MWKFKVYHLRSIAAKIPLLDTDANILLLIGRNLLRANKVRKRLYARHNNPYAQKLDLGLVIIGDLCLCIAHKPTEVSALKTCCIMDVHHHRDGRINVNKKTLSLKSHTKATACQLQPLNPYSKAVAGHLGETVFCLTNTDHQLAPSVKDVMMLKRMQGIFKDETNS